MLTYNRSVHARRRYTDLRTFEHSIRLFVDNVYPRERPAVPSSQSETWEVALLVCVLLFGTLGVFGLVAVGGLALCLILAWFADACILISQVISGKKLMIVMLYAWAICMEMFLPVLSILIVVHRGWGSLVSVENCNMLVLHAMQVTMIPALETWRRTSRTESSISLSQHS